MNFRIRLSRQTVKEMGARLRRAYQRGDVRLVRRISVLVDHLQHGVPIVELSQTWGFSVAIFYVWLHELLLHGVDSLTYKHGGGRKPKLWPTQKKRLEEWIDAGPQACGFVEACWTSLLIQELIRREFGVWYSRFYVCQLLRNMGYSFQKARFVSDHLDQKRREVWIQEPWPRLLEEAQRVGAWILFEDEASFPQWGTLGYTWARKGHQPTVKTTGKRKAFKVFGVIEFFSGRLFYRGIEGKFNAQTYQVFLGGVLSQTDRPIFLIQDGARYHTSQAMQEFFAQHKDRIWVYALPSYSPDYNPIEYLWKKTKKRATHSKYHPQFEGLIYSVEEALTYFATHPEEVPALFGRYCDEVGLVRQLAA